MSSEGRTHKLYPHLPHWPTLDQIGPGKTVWGAVLHCSMDGFFMARQVWRHRPGTLFYPVPWLASPWRDRTWRAFLGMLQTPFLAEPDREPVPLCSTTGFP